MESKIKKSIVEDVVIFDETEPTGAQSLAPDYSARAEYQSSALPKRGVAMQQDNLQRQVEEFLFYQSELLDEQQWEAYVDLFADDGVYWVPVTPEQTEWLDSPSIFAEDKHLMQVRTQRLVHPNAWSQAAEWGLSHVVGNVVIESQSEDTICSRARFQMMELRRDAVRHFAGTYRHTLVREGGDFKIQLQRVDLMNAQAPFDYVLQAWL